MLLRRSLEVLVLSLVFIIGYYVYNYWSKYERGEDYRLCWSNLHLMAVFALCMIALYMSLQRSVLYAYDKFKLKQKNRKLAYKRELLFIKALDRQNRRGGEINPYSQAMEQFMMAEVMTPHSKRKNMLNLQDPALMSSQQWQPTIQLATDSLPKKSITETIKEKLTPKTQRKANSNQQEQPKIHLATDSLPKKSMTDTIKEKLTPNTQRKTPTIPDQTKNKSINDTTKEKCTPKTNRKAPVIADHNNFKTNNKQIGWQIPQPKENPKDTKIQIIDSPVSVKRIIAELQTPKTQRSRLQGHTNPMMNTDHIV